MALPDRKPMLQVEGIKKYFPIEKGLFRRVVGQVKAVDDVELEVRQGETLGLVGESGCGKTTLGRCIVRAIEPTEGRILLRLEGDRMTDLLQLGKQDLRAQRRHMQMIFQDPYSSLDPRKTILDIVAQPLRANRMGSPSEIEDRVRDLVELVGLNVESLIRYPHAFSGGQRQRIGIARALATNPRIVIADEPVSALDVSVQAQILNLLQDLQAEFDLTMLFIAHDLSVVEHVSDRVAVMYVGKIVETAETEELYLHPLHPYTEALLSAVSVPDPDIGQDHMILPGEAANPADLPSGCYFHPRCRYAEDRCRTETPAWTEARPGHFARCHFAGELELTGVDA
ncbi:MAG: ATP-binding cassette domain-containing protein [Caldilineaceae bacterium SB0661_bin_34]|nr:ATP-binding cassette domain-containing protein [Caldilineaceae bacterium SB0661_bin_34]